MDAQLAYVRLEVGGIQRYICGTGKLKEMIGGSELISRLSGEFCQGILEELSLKQTDVPREGRDWFLETQAGAGAVCLIMPDAELASAFLTRFSEAALERFPGLPLYGTQVPMVWERESYRNALRESETRIGEQRALHPVPAGVPMLPILVSARLDGLPACEKDDKDTISVPSKTRREPGLRTASRDRLRSLTDVPEGVDIVWAEELSEMLGDEKGKVALIHIDGNDLGKLFRKKLDEASGMTFEESISAMKQLSQTVSRANETAFRKAVGEVVNFELCRKARTELIMPLRPLVMGGDDITLIIRADLALLFLSTFAAVFERESERCGERLSVGAGMVVMDASYPFAKAFSLVESLTESAKGATLDSSPRPSSVDYLVLTEDVEDDVEAYRERAFIANDGNLLTAKPFLLERKALSSFARNGVELLDELPRSAVRAAMNACHSGEKSARQSWDDLCENLERGIGGRHGSRRMPVAKFKALFPEGFFYPDKKDGRKKTLLGDYLELARLFPETRKDRDELLDRISAVENVK